MKMPFMPDDFMSGGVLAGSTSAPPNPQAQIEDKTEERDESSEI
jgi:hypothetical protein